MKSQRLGKSISKPEILNVSKNGIWILVNDREYFLDYKEYPWFENATIAQIYDFELVNQKYLHWPALDIDLGLESLADPSKFPLIAKGR